MKALAARLFRAVPKPVTRWIVGRLSARFNISVVGVLVSADGRILVLRHVFRHRHPWGLPAGFLKAGETPEQGMIREAKEEAGLDVTVERTLAIRLLRPGHMEVVVAGRADTTQALRPSAEIFEGGFFPPDALPPDIMPSHVAWVRQALVRAPALSTEA